MQLDSYRRRSVCLVLSLCVAALTGCSRQQLGLPRIEVRAVSPDGERSAFVKNHPSIDPPSQSLWLRKDDGEEVRVRRLGEDIAWCNTIAWSGDSSRVAFLVMDAYLILVDGGSTDVISERWLIDRLGSYPPHEMVRGLRLSADGVAATFRRCERRGGACKEVESVILIE